MTVLDHVGDQEAMVYAQLGQQPLVRTTATSLEPRRGTLSCLSARPPDLATATAAQPEVACVRPSIVPFLYSKRTAAARSLVSRYRQSTLLWPFQVNQPWNYPRSASWGQPPAPRCQLTAGRVAVGQWRPRPDPS